MTLEGFFAQAPRAAVAFSGGVDSAFLLWAAKRYGCDVRAYYVKTAFQPQFELEDALRLAREVDAPMTVLETDILSVPEAAANGPRRCYFCKRALFSQLWEAAPVINTVGVRDAEGNWYGENEALPDQLDETIEAYKVLLYNNIFDKSNRLEQFFSLTE